MWVLIVYIGLTTSLNEPSRGGPTAAEFSSRQSCEAALRQLQDTMGVDRGFDRRFEVARPDSPPPHETRLWTVKGVCVAK